MWLKTNINMQIVIGFNAELQFWNKQAVNFVGLIRLLIPVQQHKGQIQTYAQIRYMIFSFCFIFSDKLVCVWN